MAIGAIGVDVIRGMPGISQDTDKNKLTCTTITFGDHAVTMTKNHRVLPVSIRFPGSLTVPYCTPLPIHLPPRISFDPTSTSGCSGSTVITDTRAHGLVVVAFVCIVSDMGLGPNGTINGIGKERKVFV